MRKEINEIRTPRIGAKVGLKVMIEREAVLSVKQGRKTDTLTIGELATALYGTGTKCYIMTPESDSLVYKS